MTRIQRVLPCGISAQFAPNFSAPWRLFHHRGLVPRLSGPARVPRLPGPVAALFLKLGLRLEIAVPRLPGPGAALSVKLGLRHHRGLVPRLGPVPRLPGPGAALSLKFGLRLEIDPESILA